MAKTTTNDVRVSEMAGIAFGTPITFAGRPGVYVGFFPTNANPHKLLVNWGPEPYFTNQQITAFQVVLDKAMPMSQVKAMVQEIIEQIAVSKYDDSEALTIAAKYGVKLS